MKLFLLLIFFSFLHCNIAYASQQSEKIPSKQELLSYGDINTIGEALKFMGFDNMPRHTPSAETTSPIGSLPDTDKIHGRYAYMATLFDPSKHQSDKAEYEIIFKNLQKAYEHIKKALNYEDVIRAEQRKKKKRRRGY